MRLTSDGTKMELRQYRKKLERDKTITVLSCTELIRKPETEKFYRMYANVRLEHPKKQKKPVNRIAA